MGEATSVADLSPIREQQNETDSEVAQDGPAIWEGIRRRVDMQLGIVELHAHRLLERDLTKPEVATANSSSDALALELGLLELPSIARLARHLSATFAGGDLNETTAVHLAAASDDIRTLFSSAIAQQGTVSSQRGTILVEGDDSPAFDATCWVLASRGFELRAQDTGLDLGPEPVGVVVAVSKGPTDATDARLQALAEAWSAPLILLSTTTSPRSLRHLSRHADTLLPSEISPGIVADELVRAIAAKAIEPVAVVCGVSRDVKALLELHGFVVITLRGPDSLITRPPPPHSVVIFGRGVSDQVVAELARALRATPASRRTPVIWLHDPAQRHHTPIVAREGVLAVEAVDDPVISHVPSQLRASAFDQADAQAEDGAILSWPAAQVLVDRSLVAAHRSGTSVAVASIDIGSEVPDDLLPRLVDALARDFRRGDIVSQRSERNMVVALQGISRRVATHRMTDLFERFSMDAGTSRVGVAVFPNDGRSATELAVAADAAQTLARTNEAPNVVSTTWRLETDRASDVLVVDPDPVLASVLMAALTQRGFEPSACHDGREALALLTGERERRLPRLVLLDLDTPGLDGMTLVRRLGAASVLSQTTVLLMAPRSREADVRLALELGVADIIRKPFSTTLLLHRAARLLEDDQ